jgi:hypothetical protein
MINEPIHNKIIEKLNYFISINKIPNIIFHGQPGTGKKTIVNNFINTIYDNDSEKIKSYVMYVNSGFDKGIKFIRENLKYFAKTNINVSNGNVFKTIVLLNADKLTLDAQSALRRCIEQFSHTTRFFIIVEDKDKLLKPIISRFCDIYIPETKYGNLYSYNNKKHFNNKKYKSLRFNTLKRIMISIQNNILINKSINDIPNISLKLYEKGYSGLDILFLLETNNNSFIHVSDKKKSELLLYFNKVCKEFRNEKLIISFLINFIFYDIDFYFPMNTN